MAQVSQRPILSKAGVFIAGLAMLLMMALLANAAQPEELPKENPNPTAAPFATDVEVAKAIAKNPDFGDDVKTIREYAERPTMGVHGTEYTIGQTALPFLQVYNLTSGQPVNGTPCFIDIYSPNASKTEFVNDVLMTERGEGLYYYEFVPTEIGNHMMLAKCYLFAPYMDTTYYMGNTVPRFAWPNGYQSGGPYGQDLQILDDGVLSLRSNTTNEAMAIINYTINRNASNFQVAATFFFKTNVSKSVPFSACIWNYITKNYSSCGILTGYGNSEYRRVDFFSQFPSIAGWVNGTGSGGSGPGTTVSLRLWANVTPAGLAPANSSGLLMIDQMRAFFIEKTNQTVQLNGGGELHVSANYSEQLASQNSLLATKQENMLAILLDMHEKLSNFLSAISKTIFKWVFGQ